MWSVFNSSTTKIRIAVSRDRGQTFSKAVTITAPNQTGPSNTYIYPSIDAAGTLYIAFASFPQNGKTSTATLYVSHSSDDGQTFAPFVAAATAGTLPAASLPNTTFRDGITENFTASPTYAGHLYLTYENWDGTQMDVKFTQSTDGGTTWSAPVTVNNNVDAPGVPTDQFQPSVAAGHHRRGRRRVLRPAPPVPQRSERPARRRGTDELLHRRVAAGIQGLGKRRGAGRRQRADHEIQLGSTAAGPDGPGNTCTPATASPRPRPSSSGSPPGPPHRRTCPARPSASPTGWPRSHPDALRGTKRVLNMHLSQALSGAMQAGFAAEAVTMQSPEHRDRLLALGKKADRP